MTEMQGDQAFEAEVERVNAEVEALEAQRQADEDRIAAETIYP